MSKRLYEVRHGNQPKTATIIHEGPLNFEAAWKIVSNHRRKNFGDAFPLYWRHWEMPSGVIWMDYGSHIDFYFLVPISDCKVPTSVFADMSAAESAAAPAT